MSADKQYTALMKLIAEALDRKKAEKTKVEQMYREIEQRTGIDYRPKQTLVTV